MPAGIDQLAADMGRNGLTAADFERTFVRLEQIKGLQTHGLLDEDLRRTCDWVGVDGAVTAQPAARSAPSQARQASSRESRKGSREPPTASDDGVRVGRFT